MISGFNLGLMSQILLNMGQSLVVGSGISTFVKADLVAERH